MKHLKFDLFIQNLFQKLSLIPIFGSDIITGKNFLWARDKLSVISYYFRVINNPCYGFLDYYFLRLYLFNEAEMRRSRLVERANTEDEDEELDSWGSDTDSEVDPKDNPEDLQATSKEKSEDQKSFTEDIGPDGPEDKSNMTS